MLLLCPCCNVLNCYIYLKNRPSYNTIALVAQCCNKSKCEFMVISCCIGDDGSDDVGDGGGDDGGDGGGGNGLFTSTISGIVGGGVVVIVIGGGISLLLIFLVKKMRTKQDGM